MNLCFACISSCNIWEIFCLELWFANKVNHMFQRSSKILTWMKRILYDTWIIAKYIFSTMLCLDVQIVQYIFRCCACQDVGIVHQFITCTLLLCFVLDVRIVQQYIFCTMLCLDVKIVQYIFLCCACQDVGIVHQYIFQLPHINVVHI